MSTLLKNWGRGKVTFVTERLPGEDKKQTAGPRGPAVKTFDETRICKYLLQGTGDVRKNVVRVRTDQFDSADDDHQDDGQHDRVFRDVLTFVFRPYSPQ